MSLSTSCIPCEGGLGGELDGGREGMLGALGESKLRQVGSQEEIRSGMVRREVFRWEEELS